MLKEIFNAFRQNDVIRDLSVRLGEMLVAGQWMFTQAVEALTRKVDWQEVSEHLYQRDKEINRLEQEIRQRIVTHLAVGGNEADLAPCLILMSVVKDAERIGDYCKNIFEVARFYPKSFEHTEFSVPLDDIRHKLQALFDPAREAFLKGDDSIAEPVVKEASTLSKQCDLITQQLLNMGQSFPPDEAVAYVLLSRHYKRVAGHLANIALSVGSTVPQLDFRA